MVELTLGKTSGPPHCRSMPVQPYYPVLTNMPTFSLPFIPTKSPGHIPGSSIELCKGRQGRRWKYFQLRFALYRIQLRLVPHRPILISCKSPIRICSDIFVTTKTSISDSAVCQRQSFLGRL